MNARESGPEEANKMVRLGWRPALVVLLPPVLVLALLAGAALAAEQPFDLKVQLDLSPAMTAQLAPGDVLQVILRPETQYGIRSVPGPPIVLEKAYEPNMILEPLRFAKAIAPDQIYRLEMRVVRPGQADRQIQARYLSALDKLPRRPVESTMKMRLFLGGARDLRDNHVLLVRDSDGIYRVMLFTA